MFAVVVLGYVQEIFAELNLADSESIIADAKTSASWNPRRDRKIRLHD